MPSRRQPLLEITQNDAMSSTNGATESRRKSGRAVKVPDKFQPDATAAQSELTNGKRKRNGVDAGDDDENDVDESEDIEEEDEESADEEEAKTSKKRSRTAKKPAAKKAKTNGDASQTPEPVTRLPNRPKKAKKVAIADAEAGGLYAQVFTSGIPSEQVAIDWLKEFEEDNTIALCHLVNLILRSAGCTIEVTEDDINDPDNVPSRLNELQQEEKGKQGVEYPLIRKGHGAFRDALTDFFDSLLQTMHASGVLYDEIALIENLHLWVTTMSSSYLRPFRHTATLVSLSLATALCRVAREQASQNGRTSRQLEVEKKKKGANQGRVKDLQKSLEKGNERQAACENTISDFFDTVFVHRYRDVDPHIRTECVYALGQWMTILPGKFFEGTYLRYLGWLLSDLSQTTRHDVLDQLKRIMRDPSNVGGMRHFIERFRPRLVEMAARDADAHVRASSIEFLDMIRDAGMLEPDDIDTIGRLIFDTELRVRKAVVDFFAENIKDIYEAKIEDLGGQEAVEDVFTPDDDDHETPRLGWVKLKGLAEVLMSYDADLSEQAPSQAIRGNEDSENIRIAQGESAFVLATQVLYDSISEIQDWESLAGYLLFDHSAIGGRGSSKTDLEKEIKAAFKLEENEEAILLQVLYASVKLDLAMADEEGSKKKRSGKSNSAAQETARRLAALIPRLLKKFAANSATTTAVLRLEQLLNLDVFQQLRQDSTAYADLLHEITVQFSRHHDPNVLSEASAAFLHAKAYNDLDEVTDDQLQSLWGDTLTDFRRRFPKSTEMTVRGDLGLEQLEDLGNAVVRISKLASISNPTDFLESRPAIKSKSSDRAKMPAIEMLFECAARGLLEEPNEEFDDTEDKLVTAANKACMFYCMWKSRDLMEAVAAGDTIDTAEIEQVRERHDRFADILTSTFSSRADIDELRLVSTGAFLDVYILNVAIQPKESEANKNHGLHTLIRHVDPAVQKEITDIFAQLEKKYAKKARKTLEPPADDDEPEDIYSDAEDEDDAVTDADRKTELLTVERQLCDMAGKIVLAILAGIIDASGPLKGKLRTRIQRNRNKLGPNFKAVIGSLDEKKEKAKKSQKSKAQQEAATAKMSTERVEEEDDDDDPFDEAEAEEREDEPPLSPASLEGGEHIEEEEDDILGD